MTATITRPTAASTSTTPDEAPRPTALFTLSLMDAIEAFAATLPHASKDAVTPVITGVRITASSRLADAQTIKLATTDADADAATPARVPVITFAASDRYTMGLFVIDGATSGDGRARDASSAAGGCAVESHSDNPAGLIIPRDVAEWVAKLTAASVGAAAGAVGKNAMSVEYALRITATEPSRDGRPTNARAEVVRWGKVVDSRAFVPMSGNFPPVERLIPDEDERHGLPILARLAPKHVAKVIGYAAKYHGDTPVTFTSSVKEADREDSAWRALKPIVATVGRLTALIQPNLILK